MSKPWSEQTVDERIETLIQYNKKYVHKLTDGKGPMHELFVEDPQTFYMATTYQTFISQLEALKYA